MTTPRILRFHGLLDVDRVCVRFFVRHVCISRDHYSLSRICRSLCDLGWSRKWMENLKNNPVGGNDGEIERNDGLSEGTAAKSPMAPRQTIIPFLFLLI